MDFGQFMQRFGIDREIGRFTIDTHLLIYCDNGTHVGVWRYDRATTQGMGEILSQEDAHLARHWCKQESDRATSGRAR